MNMTILRKITKAFDEGSYSVVFFDSQGYAIKAFKKRPDAPRDHVEAVFQAEVQAYKIATSNEDLKPYVPEFFGSIICDQVLDAAGEDITNEFHLDLAYKMKKVEGKFDKSGLQDIDLISKFKAAGIKHTKDASVLYQDGTVKCIVDFAVQECELWKINSLQCLTPSLRSSA